MSDPIVYGAGYSTFTRSVLLTLDEKSVPYHLETVDIFTGAHREESYLSRQPFGKIPAFEHDGFSLFETCAITRYIDETFEGPTLQPSDPKERARMTQIMSVNDNSAYVPIIQGIVVPRFIAQVQGDAPDEAAIADSVPAAEKAAQVLDALIGSGGFAVGESFSLADAHLVPIFDYLSQMPEAGKVFGGASNLSRWWESIRTRPSVEKTRPNLG